MDARCLALPDRLNTDENLFRMIRGQHRRKDRDKYQQPKDSQPDERRPPPEETPADQAP
jgi:hypothetical protein